MNRALERLGSFCYRRWWLVLPAWVLILLALLFVRGEYGGQFSNDYTVPGSESSAGADRLDSDFPQLSGYTGQIVLQATSGSIADQATAIDTVVTNVAALPDVVSATSPVDQGGSGTVSQDGTIAYIPMAFDEPPQSLDDGYLDQLDTATQPARDAGLTVEYGGAAGEVGQETDDSTSEVIGLACALVLLLIMFRSLVAALIPLVSAVVSVLVGLSLVTLLAAVTTFPVTAPTVATLLGLGVAIDYGLFLVARHREQVDDGMDVGASAARSTGTSGGSIVVAGSTVVIAILGLYVSGVPFVGALGFAAAIVVAVAMVAALTVVPATFGMVRTLVRSPRQRRRIRKEGMESLGTHEEREAQHEQSAFARWGRMVSAHPWPWGVASVLVLVVLAIPLFSIQLGQLDAGTDPTDRSSRQAYDLVSEGFGPGANGVLTVVVEEPSGDSADDFTALLTSLQQTLGSTAGVASASPPAVSSSGTTAVVNVVPTTSPQDPATTDLVNRLRDDVLPTVDATTYVTGTTAGYADFTAKVAQRMLYLILAVVALAFVLLMVAFRSLLIPTKAAVLNLLSVAAAYGVVVAVFQWGWGSGLIGIEENLPIPAFVPMLMFAIIFGLSMDYEVFLLSRVHEAWVKTGDAHRAVAIGIGSTARTITTAAAIMVVVFSSFVLDDDATVKMLAVGMAVAVLIDASVVRMVLVPSIMTLLDHRAWWLPGWLDRVTPNLEIEGPAAAPEPAVPEPRAAADERSDRPLTPPVRRG